MIAIIIDQNITNQLPRASIRFIGHEMKLTEESREIAREISWSACKAGVITRVDLPWWEVVFSPFAVLVSELIERGAVNEATQCAPSCRLRDLVSLVKPVLHDPVFVLPNKENEAKGARNGRGLCYSSLVPQKPIEKALWKVFCYRGKHLALEFDLDVASNYPPVDDKGREAIKNGLRTDLHVYVDLIPASLYEGGQQFRAQRFAYEAGDVHEISPRVLTDEKYLFFLATIKEQGVFLLGMPHGGVYLQTERPSINEQAERVCADTFAVPDWVSDNECQIPNKRASLAKQIFLKRRVAGFLKGKRRNDRLLLLVLPLEVCNDKVYVDFFRRNLLKAFLHHFGRVYKGIAVRFHPKMGDACRSSLVKQIESSSGVEVTVDDSISFFESGVTYSEIFYVNPFATGLMELGQGGGTNFVLLHKSMGALHDYERYLRENCDESLIINGGYEVLSFGRKVVPAAYGANYLHPRQYVRSIEKCIRQEGG